MKSEKQKKKRYQCENCISDVFLSSSDCFNGEGYRHFNFNVVLVTWLYLTRTRDVIFWIIISPSTQRA